MAKEKTAKLSGIGFALAGGIYWGLAMVLAGWTSIFGWGTAFVVANSSLYIGYESSFIGGIIGGIWGFATGFIAGGVFSYFYNMFRK